MDHSAFDAYSLLVEADDKQVFYSGDFRGHGRKAALFEQMIRRPPRNIDVLLMEGTTIGRTGSEEGFPTEQDLEEQFAEAFKKTNGIHFVWASVQNIDRLVTVFRAAKKTGRFLIISLYAAVVLEATGGDRIPQSDWDGVKVYTPQSERVWVKENELIPDLERHKRNRIFPEDLPALRERAVMLFSPRMVSDWGVQGALEGARFTYSMWSGLSEGRAMSEGVAMAEEERRAVSDHSHVGPRFRGRPAAVRCSSGPTQAGTHPHLRRRPLQRAIRQRSS